MHVTASAQKQWHHYKGMLAAAGGRQADDAPPQQRSKHKQETLQDGEQLAVKRARRSVAADQAAEVLASDDVQPVSSQLATSQPSACHEHEQMDSKVPQQPQQEEYQAQDARVLYDTAGCIYVSASGEVAAGVSSGGIAVKVDGRVGEAAMYGCGCWASSSEDRAEPSVACSVTGVGESIMRACLARTCCDHLVKQVSAPIDEVCSSVITQLILQQSHPGPSLPKDCGIIAVRAVREPGQSHLLVEFTAVHTSRSMGFAFLHPQISKPSCHMLRHEQPDGQQPSTVSFGCFASLRR